MTIRIENGNCLELMKNLDDKSVDLFICDLPYGETNCKWDCKIDLDEFWSEFKRIRKSKKTACIHFCSTKFGYTLIKSNEAMFKMDMVWKKRNKTGGLQSRNRPMRNHEMVYFFYEQAPKYNRDKYHKRIQAKNETINNVKGNITNAGNPEGASNFNKSKFFEPPNPASVVEEVDEFGWDKSVVKEKGNKIGKMGGNFEPVNPVSVVEEKDKEEKTDIYGETKDDRYIRYKKFGTGDYEPPNPASVLEEPEPVSMFESTKVFIGKRHHQTEKPQDILEFFIKYWTDEGETILDPTMGSGSTGVACKGLNRNFIGFELDDKIYNVAEERINKTEKLI